MPQRVGIYCRISKDDGSALGVKRQERECRQLARAKGWTVADVLVDNDVSAYNGQHRPAYEQLLAGLRDGRYDGVLAYKLDRLTRSGVRGLSELLDVLDGRPLACVHDQIDTTTAMGEGVAGMLASMGRQESDNIGTRMRSKHAELAQAGKPVGGFRPYGYTKANGKLTVRKREADLLRNAAKRVLAGDSIRAIVMDWNRRGLRGPRGGRWTQHTLTRVLQSPRLVGDRTLHGEVIGKGNWDPILDRPTWESVRGALASRHTRTGFGARRYLLVGFLVCGECGTRLISQPRTDRRRSYCCSSSPDKGGCGGVRTVAEPLEEVVVEAIMQAVDSPALARAVADKHKPTDETNDDAAELERARDRLAELSRLWAQERISRVEWMEARKVVEERIEAAERRLAARSDQAALELYVGRQGALRKAWKGSDQRPALSLDRKRAVIAALVDRIVVNRAAKPHGGRFDPDRIDIVWRA